MCEPAFTRYRRYPSLFTHASLLCRCARAIYLRISAVPGQQQQYGHRHGARCLQELHTVPPLCSELDLYPSLRGYDSEVVRELSASCQQLMIP
jgi:hypothetical protein